MAIPKRFRKDVKLAKSLWHFSPISLLTLLETLRKHRLSLALGDLLLIGGRWYVTHSGLLNIATRKQCRGIRITAVAEFCKASALRSPLSNRAPVASECKGFVGYGDADPSNVLLCPRRRDARRGNPSRQPSSAQSLRNRHLLGRGDRFLRRASSASQSRRSFRRNLQWQRKPRRSAKSATASAN